MAATSPSTPAPGGAPCPDIRKLSLNGMTPFMSGVDIRDDALRGAHALLHLLSAAFEDAGELIKHSRGGQTYSITDTINNQIKADAMSAIAGLVAFAQFGSDLEDHEAAERRVNVAEAR